MDGCFKILMDEIHHYEGTINQFTGDGVMALFGAPLAHEDQAQRACNAALSIQKALIDFKEKVIKDFGADFKMRIGLNSGPVIVGAIGDDLRMDYTAVGDTTNVAMRMQSLATPGSILVSENTHRIVKAYFDFEDCGPVVVKGKEAPQNAYRLIKSGDAQTWFEASVSKGLVKFVGRRNSMAEIKNAWDKAHGGSGQVLGVAGEAGVGKSRLLLEFRRSLPIDEVTYLEGRCLHYGSSMPFLPFLDILRFFLGIEEGQREYIVNKNIKNRLAELDKNFFSDSLSAFQDLFSIKAENESWHKLEPKQKRERTFEALRNLFIRASEKKTLVLAVEDLHWIDKTSEEFIGYFINEKRIFPELEYTFKHALTQEVAYSSLLIQRRKEIHEKIGQAIEEIYGERLQEFYEILAYHFSRSEDFYKAYQYSRLSGEKAAENYSYREAYGFNKIARNLLDRLPESEENKKRKIEVLRLMAGPIVLLGWPAESLEILMEGEKLSKELQDDYHLARFHSVIGGYYTWKADPTLGKKYAESAFERARINLDIELMASLAVNLSNTYVRSGDHNKVVAMAPDVIELIEKENRKSDFFKYFTNPYSTLCAVCGFSMKSRY